jgi:threonine dehydrogenase-like Zn-dependent dehydrogenase
MRALIYDGALNMTDIPAPEPQEGEVLIRVLWSSICNTDLEIVKGYMNFKGIPGHEFVGEVISRGSRFSGKKVVGEINCSCGQCVMCLSGNRTHCVNRSVLGIFNRNGVFAEYTALPEENLHLIPDGVTETEAVFTEPLAAALRILDQVSIGARENVFIFGCGKLGMLISQVFHISGIDYRAFDVLPLKVSLARQTGLNAEVLSSLDPAGKAWVCIDCTGNPEGIRMAMSHLHPTGTLVLKTTVAKPADIDLNQVVINEFRIVGSRCGSFRPALGLLQKKTVTTSRMVSEVFDFTDIIRAFEFARKDNVIKVLLNHTG